MNSIRFSLLLLAAVVSSGCSEELEPCEPLSPTTAPLELGTVIAVGKAKDGNVFAVDQPGESSELRVFKSEGKTLVRRDVSGSGEANDGAVRRIGLLVDGDDELFRLLVELRGTTTTRMMVVEGAQARERELDISTVQGEDLEVVGKAALDALEVQNLAGDIYVEYSARVSDGRRLIVTRPEHDWSYEDFRVFFGPADQLAERHVSSVTRARDGGSTQIQFEVDSESAEAFFPSRRAADGVTRDEPDMLEIGAKSFEVERLPMDAPELEGLSFECLP